MKHIHLCVKDYAAVIAPDMPLIDENLAHFQGDIDLSFMPPLERRRLGNAAKCVFSVAKSLESSFDLSSVPIVFSSYYGEINRCYGLLNTLRQNDLLSPTEFSLSVLNANAALLAINKSNHSEINAVSGENSFEMGVFAAALKGLESKEYVLLIDYYEELDSDFRAKRYYALGALLCFASCTEELEGVQAKLHATLSFMPNTKPKAQSPKYSALTWLCHATNKSNYQIADDKSTWCWDFA